MPSYAIAYTLLLLLGGLPTLLTAQTGQLRCPSDESRYHFSTSHPEAQELMAKEEAKISRWIADYQSQGNLRSDEIYTIPVVVHVVWYDDEDNIPETQILSQIDVLNEDFNFKNRNTFFIPAEFEDRVANVGFEFCLATVTPDGRPTTGITRTQTDYDGIGNYCVVQDILNRKRLFRTDLGGADPWDTERYLNIWVAPMGGLLGRATPPTPFTSNDPCGPLASFEDGVVVDPKFFGLTCHPPNHLGRTATHEIGHYFNLIHVFGLDADDCDTDFVSDTPEQLSAYSGCPTYPQRSCLSPATDMFMNFMDLVDDECMAMFTEGQKMRMLAALLGPRRGLIEQMTCTLPTPPAEESLLAYPNPATNCLFVELATPNPDQNVKVRVYDAAGKLAYRSQHNAGNITPILLRTWGAGVFILEVESDMDTYVEKIMVVD